MANGTYDVGFGDINALIELAAKKPDDAPIAVYVMFNQPPFTVAVKADSPIKTPKDFEGKTLGGAANDGALKLFPAFCKLTKIDCTKVNITNMQPNLREQMLMQGQVDGVFGYVNTIRFSAKLMGVDDSQLRYINYGDYGMDLYSNAIIVSKKLVKENPKAVAGLVRAINRGLIDSLKDIDAAVAAVAKREPLIKVPVEKERFVATLQGRDEPSRDRQDRTRQRRSGAAEEVDRHPGRRQQPAAHAGGQRNLHAGLPAGREGPAEEAVLAAGPLRQSGSAARTTTERHGPQSQRAGCDDHRPRQGHGRGDHQGVRGRRREARAGRPRHRRDRAGRRRRRGRSAPRRSSCPAISPMPKQCEQAAAATNAAFGRIDILVNVAGGSGPIGKTGVETTPEEFDDIVTLNMNGCFHTMRAALPTMMAQRYGKIVNVGGTFGMRGRAGRMAYSASKWGLRGITKSFALEVGPYNINVNCVAPGMVDGPRFRDKVCADMAQASSASRVEEAVERHAADYALKRVTIDADVANACLFLASDASRQITGVDLPVDGGWAML